MGDGEREGEGREKDRKERGLGKEGGERGMETGETDPSRDSEDGGRERTTRTEGGLGRR